MTFLADYGLFLAKTFTIVVAILIILVALVMVLTKNKMAQYNRIKFKSLSKQFFKLRKEYHETIAEKPAYKQFLKSEKKRIKTQKTSDLPRIFVITYDGDVRASQTQQLVQQINAILSVANSDDKVILRLTSGGGMVPNYGHAAAQLLRLKKRNIHLIVCIDCIAASGGYLMAAVADEIVAAPFAIIGSIGVVAQIPNFHKLLKHNHIDFEQVTAGEYKRTLTMFGENTEKSRLKVQEEVDAIHQQFKSFISEYRPAIDIAQVGTGEYWSAELAKEMNLVDRLNTSQDEIFDKYQDHNIFEVIYLTKKRIPEILTDSITNSVLHLYQKLTHSIT